jgi:hypothetical protein
MQMKGFRRVSSKRLQLKALKSARCSLCPLQHRIGAWAPSVCPDLLALLTVPKTFSFLSLIGRVVAFAIDDNFNLMQAENARRELQRQNERPQQTAQSNSSIDGGWITPAYPQIKYKAGVGQVRFIRMI